MAQLNSRSTQQRRAGANGFSLIELLIVVAIILIIVAIAIPDLLRARIAANQADAVENCRTITSAQVIYYTMYGVGFAPTLATLGGTPPAAPDASGAQLIDGVLATGTKSGYIFTYAALSPDPTGAFQDYALNADPSSPKVTGIAHYFTNEPSVIHVNMNSAAGVNDPPIQ